MRKLSLVVVAGGVSSALLVPALATSAPPVAVPGDGLALLRDAAWAVANLRYHGTQVVSVWSAGSTTSAVVEVSHTPGEGTLMRVAPTPSHPGSVVFERDGAGLDEHAVALIAANYEANSIGTEPIAGREADLVAVRLPGGAPVVRFWLDRLTRLPLRQQTLDTAGRTVRESVYVDVAFTLPAASERMQVTAMPAAAGDPVGLDGLDGLRAAGWQVPATLASGLHLFDVRLDRRRRVLHLSYYDGMSGASVFQQPGRLDVKAMRGWRRQRVGGADVLASPSMPLTLAWSSRGTVYTVVADCPLPVLEDLVRSLPHGEPRRGVLTRMRRGVIRVGSWFNPFG